MNKIILQGRLVDEAETKTFSGANAGTVTNFRIAVSRTFKREGKPTADFFRCQAWNKTGENIAKYFHKGNRILVIGRIENEEYINRDGQKAISTMVTVEDFDFCESQASSGANASGNNASVDPAFMDVANAIGDELPFV